MGSGFSWLPKRKVVRARICSLVRCRFGMRSFSVSTLSLPLSQMLGSASLCSKKPFWSYHGCLAGPSGKRARSSGSVMGSLPPRWATSVSRAKSRRSIGLLPSIVSSVPMRPSSSRPEISWHPAQPKWVRHFGCAGCHEISGLEEEGRIGTELTIEGSKPIERLDFALLTDVAQRGGSEPITDPDDLARLPEGPAKQPWYDQKGFFEHKLAEPNIWDKGKDKVETEKLRMPNLHLTREQIRALTTFLLCSQENPLPASYQHRPLDYRRDIQEGWWVVKKYNCMGCHQLIPGQKTSLMGMARSKDAQEQLPPKLLTEGARVDPEWLLRFLK